ncbi:MAG: hypothetical protein IJB96_12550 [Lachnospira sp.]|nr:hypothetical protein [Lachnospira sp.]
MTGKDLYKAMQNVDESLITESADIKVTKKKVKWQLTERQRDNLATAAIVLLVVGLVAIVPVIVKSGDLGASGINATTSVDATDVAVENPTEDITKTEETETEKVPTDNIIDTKGDRELLANAVVASGSMVIDGRLYEYDKAKERFVISVYKYGGNSLTLDFSVGGFAISSGVKDAIAYNAIVTEKNADDMYYLVEIEAYDYNHTYANNTQYNRVDRLGSKDAKDVYERIKNSGKYSVVWCESGNHSYTYDGYILNFGPEGFMYGILNYEQMKSLAKDFDDYGFAYSLLSKTVKNVNTNFSTLY